MVDVWGSGRGTLQSSPQHCIGIDSPSLILILRGGGSDLKGVSGNTNQNTLSERKIEVSLLCGTNFGRNFNWKSISKLLWSLFCAKVLSLCAFERSMMSSRTFRTPRVIGTTEGLEASHDAAVQSHCPFHSSGRATTEACQSKPADECLSWAHRPPGKSVAMSVILGMKAVRCD
jgi:hypothetical protein